MAEAHRGIIARLCRKEGALLKMPFNTYEALHRDSGDIVEVRHE